MEVGYRVRKIEKAYELREEDPLLVMPENPYDIPTNANKVFGEVSQGALQQLGEGESALQDQEGVVIRFTKINGKLYQEDTLIEEVE